MAPVSCVKKGGGGGLLLLTFTLPVVLRLLSLSSIRCWLPRRCWRRGHCCLCVNKGEEKTWGGSPAFMDSDDDLRRHCLDDVARPLTCQIVFIPSKRCVFTLSSPSVRLADDVALPGCSRRWGSRMVAGGSGYRWWWRRSGGGRGCGREGKGLFVHDLYVSFRQTPLTRLSIKTQRLLT